MTFWLGVPEAVWLQRTPVPMMISRNRLLRNSYLPAALGPWVLDSGGFTEIGAHGAWTLGAEEYVAFVRRLMALPRPPTWCAPQDWMCEPLMLAKTGRSIAEHQKLTIDNLLELRALAPEIPWIPVLQGWVMADYLACVGMYADAGVDLREEPLVGLGSVCRRQAQGEAEEIVRALHGRGLRIHGFGVKTTGLRRYGHLLTSSDSMAWSFGARRTNIKAARCTRAHADCRNCMIWALEWRARLIPAKGRTTRLMR